MTHDGHNGLDLEYNRMNLMQKVTRNSTSIADYRYLYDGTKTNAMCRFSSSEILPRIDFDWNPKADLMF